jgi:GTP-sensing pleiotropic transcriptional regulator CodY
MLMFPSTRRPHLARNKDEVRAIREQRAVKSFRAAADRIVRQESAMPSVVSRLLTTPIVSPRRIATDADEWSIRLAALAALGQYDALTFVVDGSARARYAHNVADDPLGDDATRVAVEETRRSGSTVQTHTAIRLADDRVAAAVMVAPFAATETASGVLIALRAGRSFAATDALTASDISDLVALEVAREALAERDQKHRQQAFALYELSRLALFGERLAETLQDTSVLVTTAFDNDVAQIWLLASDGALELRAAYPNEDLRPERLRPAEYPAFAESLHQQRLVRIGQGALRPWVPAETKELFVVPLVDGARTLGVLVLGRAAERYEDADEEMAGMLGRFIARVVSRAAAASYREAEGRTEAPTREADPHREWAEEPQLTPS